jgi:hypothetical protein
MSTKSCLRFLKSQADIFVLGGVLLTASATFSSTIYNNTILSGAVSGLISSDRTIQIDDVLVPSLRDPAHLALAVNSITFDFSGAIGQSTQFSLYLFPVKSDGTPDPNFTLIGTTSVVFTSPFQLVTFGNGSGKLFTVNPNFTVQTGFGLFYIGVAATSNFPGAGWAWANGPDANLPTAYLDNLTAGQIFLNTSGPPFPPNFSFYMKIDASPVPEPSALVMLGTGLVGVLGAARRKSRR